MLPEIRKHSWNSKARSIVIHIRNHTWDIEKSSQREHKFPRWDRPSSLSLIIAPQGYTRLSERDLSQNGYGLTNNSNKNLRISGPKIMGQNYLICYRRTSEIFPHRIELAHRYIVGEITKESKFMIATWFTSIKTMALQIVVNNHLFFKRVTGNI